MSLTGMAELKAKIATLKARMGDLSVPLNQAGLVVRDAAVNRIKSQGGDQTWIPNKRGGHTGIDTGTMWRSIQVEAQGSSAVSVGTNVEYAKYFQFGTGVYAGHQPWTITAKKGRPLQFTIGGTTYYRASVIDPGQPARAFLVIGDKEKSGVVQVFQRWFNLEDVV